MNDDEEQEGSLSSPPSSRTSRCHHHHCAEYAPILPLEHPPPDDDVPAAAAGVGASTTVFWLLSDEESSSSTSLPPPSSLVSSPGRTLGSICRLLMSSPFWQHHSFWMGSLLLVIAATLNLVNTWMDKYYYDDDDDDQGNSSGIGNGNNATDDERLVGTSDPLACWDAYKVLMVGGSFLYLLDSVLHIRSKYHSSHRVQSTADGTDQSTLSSSSSLSFLARMFRTGDEDDTSLWFACIFGIASAFDLCCSFLQDDDYPWPAYVFECLSVYLFGMSANFLLYSKRDHYLKHQPCCQCSLMGWGDAFYWIGCTTDIVVSVLDNPTNQEKYGWWNAIGCMASALFWFTDALLYECAGADIFDMEVLVQEVLPPEGGPGGRQRMIAIPHDEEHDDDEEERIDDDEAPESYSLIQEKEEEEGGVMDDLFLAQRQQE